MAVLGSPDDNLAPSYTIIVEGQEINIGVTQLINSVEYESSDGVADMMKINAANPDMVISDSKIFAPGNEMELWGGYGSRQTYIGAVVIARNEPDFPDGGELSIVVTGYTRDREMMSNSPPKAQKFKGKGSVKKNRRAKELSGRHFKDSKYSDAVKIKAADYGMEADVDPTPESPHEFIQKSGMTDYEFVQGLSNLTGYLFWVDRTQDGAWTLHFRDPGALDLQTKKYTYSYYNGDQSTLMSFRPELSFQDANTNLIVEVKNPRTGEVMKAELEEPDIAQDVAFRGGKIDSQEKIKEPIPSGASVKLCVGDFSFDVITSKQFSNQAELQAWADQWFRRNRENFVLSQGTIIGTETVMARQTHALEGLGVVYSGDYYFSRVRHMFGADAGYICDFSCRKVL